MMKCFVKYAVAGGREQSLAEFQYQHHISRFKNILEKSKDGFEDFAAEVKPIISKCAALSRIQSSLISQWRKQNYGNDR